MRHDSDALESLRAEARGLGLDEKKAEDWLTMMSLDGDVTAYLFRCLHCGAHLAYCDAD